jgi:hypothetical protein
MDHDANTFKVAPALPPETIDGFGDTWLRAPKRGTNELVVRRIEALQAIWDTDLSDVHAAAASDVSLVDQSGPIQDN